MATLSPEMVMSIDCEKLLSMPSGHLTPLPPLSLDPWKFERSESQEEAPTPKLLPGQGLAAGALHEKLTRLAEKQVKEAAELPPGLCEEALKVHIPEANMSLPPPAPHSVPRDRKGRLAAVVSKGSVGHPFTCAAACKYVKRKGGCRDGADCVHCHECFWSKAKAKETEDARKEAEAVQDGELIEKIMHLLKEEGALAQVPEMNLSGQWGLNSYMGVSIPGVNLPVECQGLPMEQLQGSEAVNPGSMGHPYSCGPACKYVWKSRGCKDGDACTHCHLCRWTRYSAKHQQLRI